MRDGKGWRRLLERVFKRSSQPTPELHIPGSMASVGDLPAELMDPIVDHLVTNSPAETARDIATFRSLNKATRQFVDGDPLVRRLQLPPRAIELAGKIFAKSYPRSGLPDIPGGARRMNDPISAGDHLTAIGPVLRFLPGGARSKVVDDVRALRHPSARADAVLALAKHSDFSCLPAQDRKFLIDEGIRLLGSGGNALTFRSVASAEAIVIVRHHMAPEQKFELDQKLSGNRRLKTLFETKLRESASHNEAAGAVPRARISAGEIERLHRQVQAVSRSIGFNRMFGGSSAEHKRLQKIGAIAQALSNGVGDDYSNARNEFLQRREIRYADRSESRGR
ncbi:hypothetical protein QE369_002035 [Agrobacterium larrymoorei]|uniref:Uncharacterized protein n=1 Tax=Agrobacterium larrymoorei TaxID=160699 RepID=A0AAJ2BDG9_9HYPH|nr:hypothetical protein [Agrobacterium larrymoorei]MDR6101838.1 hypothetical protein [Agrobacterium larrymoorei]